jgi:uncharacterized membrane protein YesL
MRRFWARSLQIAAIDLVIGLLATANVIIVSQLGMPPAPGAISLGITAFVAAMTLAANLYIWTLMVAFDLPIRDLIQTSLRKVFVHPAWTLMMLALALVVLLIGVTAPAVIWIFALFSGCAWLVNRGAWQVIRQYEDDLTH